MTHTEVVVATRERLGAVGVWLGAALNSAPVDRGAPGGTDGSRSSGTGRSGAGNGSAARTCSPTSGCSWRRLGPSSWAPASRTSGRGTPPQCRGAPTPWGPPIRAVSCSAIGVSHAASVDRSGQTYQRPLDYMARYLDGMDVAAGNAPAPEVPVPRVLAALRPHMLALARDRADGAHPYFVPPEHTAMAREALGADKLLVPEQAVVLDRRGEAPPRSLASTCAGTSSCPTT